MGDGSRDLALVQDLYRQYGEGRIEGIFAALDPDFTFTSCGPSHQFGTSGVWKGREGLVAYLEKLNADWRIEEHTPLEFIQQGSRIVVRTRVVTRSRRTDQCATLEKADFWTVEDGRILSFQEIFDTASALAACPGQGL